MNILVELASRIAGAKEEQRGKVMPGNVEGFAEMFNSVLKAQKGMNAELQLEVRWGGWLEFKNSFPENEYSVIKLSSMLFNEKCLLPA